MGVGSLVTVEDSARGVDRKGVVRSGPAYKRGKEQVRVDWTDDGTLSDWLEVGTVALRAPTLREQLEALSVPELKKRARVAGADPARVCRGTLQEPLHLSGEPSTSLI